MDEDIGRPTDRVGFVINVGELLAGEIHQNQWIKIDVGFLRDKFRFLPRC